MRLAVVSEVYSKAMGYAENLLPKALAKLGVEVHLITSHLKPYYFLPDFRQTYGVFADACSATLPREVVDQVTVHYLKHRRLLGYVRLEGLHSKLRALKPDIVQTFSAISWIPLEAAIAQYFLGYKLFTGSHTTASVFPLAQRVPSFLDKDRLLSIVRRAIPGRLVSIFTEKCYAATKDCADVASGYFGVPTRKVEICPLGVDTDVFHPINNGKLELLRVSRRNELGIRPSEIVCIYTGRFTQDKNPLVLAQAIARLVSSGEPFRGLFVGGGIQEEAIRNCVGCITHPFVPFTSLPSLFYASDIGVWPTQESTTMLDAAASGIPIVVNNTLIARERIEGTAGVNGLTYKLNDVADLARVLLRLKNPILRRTLGDTGAKRMESEFSWRSIANRRLSGYEAALNRK